MKSETTSDVMDVDEVRIVGHPIQKIRESALVTTSVCKTTSDILGEHVHFTQTNLRHQLRNMLRSKEIVIRI